MNIEEKVNNLCLELYLKTGIFKPRQLQLDAIINAIKAYESGKKYVIIQAVTGSGKSYISYIISLYYNSSYFLTVQKILQEQYKNDFDIPIIMSKSNYNCNKINGNDCSVCLKQILGINRCQDCPYKIAYEKAFKSDMCSSNYSYILALAGANISINTNRTDNNLVTTRKLVVCDECHQLFSELISRGTLVISLEKETNIQNIYSSDIFLNLNCLYKMNEKQQLIFITNTYKDFVYSKYIEAENILNDLLSKKQKTNNIYSKIKKVSLAVNYWKEQYCHIEDMLNCAYPNVVISFENNILTIKPLFANGFFKKLLTKFGNKFLFMSATLLDYKKFLEELNLNENECEYINIDNAFPVKNRPIFYYPSGSMSYNNKHNTYPKLLANINNILDKHKNEKGIIHCVNYEISKKILDFFINKSNFNRLVFINAKNKHEKLNEFYKSDKPLILVSPSLNEGLDLKDDLSRLCIICKVPYASLGDKWVRKKLEIDKKWYSIKTAETIIQQTGRSIRSNEDYATTYILDSDFLQFYNYNTTLFPKWWSDAINWKHYN